MKFFVYNSSASQSFRVQDEFRLRIPVLGSFLSHHYGASIGNGLRQAKKGYSEGMEGSFHFHQSQ